MEGIILTTSNIRSIVTEDEAHEYYLDLVDQFIRLNGAVDIMRVGMDYISKNYPDNTSLLTGSVNSLKTVIQILIDKLDQIRIWRIKIGMTELSADMHVATEQLYTDHCTAKDE